MAAKRNHYMALRGTFVYCNCVILDAYLCRVMSSAEVGAVGNCAVDYPGPAPLTFPAPPTKRSRHRSGDTVSSHSSSTKQTKTKLHSSVSSAADLTSQSVVMACSRENLHSSQCESVEIMKETGLSNPSDTISASSGPLDSRMRVLWSGQVAVNGTNISSAELLSRCHIRHTL